MAIKLINRDILGKISSYFDTNKILALIGPRQVGKTSILSLIKNRLTREKPDLPILTLNAEKTNDLLYLADFNSFLSFLESRDVKNKKSVVFIDEFQKMSHPTKLLKLIYDELPRTKIICTGSSSLEIFARLNEESMAGRKHIFNIFPLSFSEFLKFRYPEIYPIWENTKKIKDNNARVLPEIILPWHDFAVWGGYPRPALIAGQEKRREELEEIYNSYIQKDVAGIIKKDEKIAFTKLVILLSSQNGQLLNINELSNTLSLARSAIERFLFVLEETFIIKLLPPYFTNKRKEIVKMPKIYFIDAGMRNSVKHDFSPLDLRPDNGQLAENFVFTELFKHAKVWHQFFFWRTPYGTETDFIIKRDQNIFPIEVKYKSIQKPIVPSGMKAFINHYRPKRAFVLTRDFTARTNYNNTAVHFLPIPFAAQILSLVG